MTLRDLLKTPASKNAAACYLAFSSTALWGLASIPVAVAFLEPEQIGLWAIVNALLSYLAWADLGIGPAIGRLVAPAIANKNQQEMNRLWTTTRAALFIQGIIVIVIGQLLCLFIGLITQCSDDTVSDANLLLGGGAAILGLTFPIRGAAGILTAEHRYHWAPLVQAVSPWVNILVFFTLLKLGLGLKAYLFAFAASQIFNWVCFKLLLAYGPNRFFWDREGIRFHRFRELFSFCGNIAVAGTVDSIIRTLPHLILAQVASLLVVPLYNFTSRTAALGANLIEQTVRSFYPGLQRLFINSEAAQFKQRHHQVCMITISLAVVGASAMLIINQPVVQLLAGDTYYAGSVANTWFAISLITTALSTLYRIMLPISGNMGKMAAVSIIKIPVAVVISILYWPHTGINGMAAIFALMPLIDGIYAAYRGSINCGYRPMEMLLTPAIFSLVFVVLTWCTGSCLDHLPTSEHELQIGSKMITVPNAYQILPPIGLAFVGSFLGLHQMLILMRKQS